LALLACFAVTTLLSEATFAYDGHSTLAAKGLTQAEASAANKINNILTKNFKPGPKGDISGAIHDMVGNPIPKPGGGTYDHVQDLGNMLRGLRNNADALRNATDPAAVAARQQAQQAIQQIEQAIKGAGL
jgi:filamentous hemagglutinin